VHQVLFQETISELFKHRNATFFKRIGQKVRAVDREVKSTQKLELRHDE
jgi:hypothetical protein